MQTLKAGHLALASMLIAAPAWADPPAGYQGQTVSEALHAPNSGPFLAGVITGALWANPTAFCPPARNPNGTQEYFMLMQTLQRAEHEGAGEVPAVPVVIAIMQELYPCQHSKE